MINPQEILSSLEKNKGISAKVRKKTRVPTVTTTLQHSFGSFSQAIREEKKWMESRFKRRSKTLTVCRQHDPLHKFSSVAELCLTLCELMNCSLSVLSVLSYERRASLSITNFWNSPKLMSMESVMPSSSSHPLSSPSLPFPASGSYKMSLFHIRWPNY